MQLEKLVGGGKAAPCLTDMQLKGENEGEGTDSGLYFWCSYSVRIVMTIKTGFLLVIFQLCTSILRSCSDALLNSLLCLPFYGCGFIFRKRLAKQPWSYSKSPSLRVPGSAQAENIPSAASTWTVTLPACGALTSGHPAIFGAEKLQMNEPMLGILQICRRHVLLGMFPF